MRRVPSPPGGDQQHRHRRVLQHGVEQQFALHEALALFTQHVAEFAVCGDEFGQFILAAPVDAEVVFAVAVGVHAAGQRTQQGFQRR